MPLSSAPDARLRNGTILEAQERRPALCPEFMSAQLRTLVRWTLLRRGVPHSVSDLELPASVPDIVRVMQALCADLELWVDRFAGLYRELCGPREGIPLNVAEHVLPGMFTEIAASPDLRDHRHFLNDALRVPAAGVNPLVLRRLRSYFCIDRRWQPDVAAELGRVPHDVDVGVDGALVTLRKRVIPPHAPGDVFRVFLAYPNVRGSGIGCIERYKDHHEKAFAGI